MKEIGQLKVFDDADDKAGACTDVCILFTNKNIENNNINSNGKFYYIMNLNYC